MPDTVFQTHKPTFTVHLHILANGSKSKSYGNSINVDLATSNSELSLSSIWV